MYRYTLKKHYRHYFHDYGPHYRRYVEYAHRGQFTQNGCPNDYGLLYVGLTAAYYIEYYSKKPLSHVPCAGYLIPVHFFDEVKVE